MTKLQTTEYYRLEQSKVYKQRRLCLPGVCTDSLCSLCDGEIAVGWWSVERTTVRLSFRLHIRLIGQRYYSWDWFGVNLLAAALCLPPCGLASLAVGVLCKHSPSHSVRLPSPSPVSDFIRLLSSVCPLNHWLRLQGWPRFLYNWYCGGGPGSRPHGVANKQLFRFYGF